MPEVGEEIVGAWLRMVEKCDFVQYNVPTREKQGEIDVIGINLATQTAYICEVATHTQGFRYSKNSLPNNVAKLVTKFKSDIEYANKYLTEFKCRFMFWSPVVKTSSEDAKYNTFRDLNEINQAIHSQYTTPIEWVINEHYLERIQQLRSLARTETAASEFPIFRLLQIIEQNEIHVAKLQKKGFSSLVDMLPDGLLPED